MNPETFAKWFHRQGYHVIQTENSYWVNLGPRIYQAFPYHWLITPSKGEIRTLLRNNHAVSLRYSTPITVPSGRLSYHTVYTGTTYTPNDLTKKARHDVRKGLEFAKYERISLTRLANEGWDIRKDTLIRQGRNHAETQSWWKTLCDSAEGLAGFEAWGVIHNDRLIACLLAFTCDNCFSILYQQSLATYLQHGINNALTYVVTNNAITRPEISEIFYGLHSLDAPPSVDEFKFRMGYSPKPVRQNVSFHPWLAPIFNSLSHRALKLARKLRPGNLPIAKAEGLIQFYLEGQQPLDRQSIPAGLLGKEQLLQCSQNDQRCITSPK